MLAQFLTLAACAGGHTLENTQNMNGAELAALCDDLRMRATQECRWNTQQPPTSIENRQTWEINCQARRESAQKSYDEICMNVAPE